MATWNPDVLLESVLNLAAPPERESLSAWADAHRVLSSEASAAPGEWRTLPFQREPLDAIRPASPYETVVLVWASQLGSNSAAGLGSRPIRYLLLDELDRFEERQRETRSNLALARTRTLWNRKGGYCPSRPVCGGFRIWIKVRNSRARNARKTASRPLEIAASHLHPKGEIRSGGWRCLHGRKRAVNDAAVNLE